MRISGRRVWSMILVICLVLSMIPAFVSQTEVEAEAVSGLSSLTCSSFISNSARQNYIDVMMRYYIDSNSTLQSQLNSGNVVVFMFEGGSDYYDTYPYVDGYGQTRMQAVCIVVKLNSSGNASIVFYSEKCCSIPDDANYVTVGNEYNSSTTILDGIYKMSTVDHNGNYAAHTTSCSNGWYTPYSGSTGYAGGCNGINIHTRGVNYALSYGGNSMGCQLIGYGANSSNEYNTFMKTVVGISFNAYDGTQRTYGYGSHPGYYTNTGYYVVDRQLGLTNPSGTDYGSGSLTALYTKGDLDGITSFSTKARANADFDYSSKCTYYPAHCKIRTTDSATVVNTQPCSIDSDPDSVTIETVPSGKVYTATGLFKNTYGNLWYRVTASGGKTGYIYGGDAEYVEQITSDIGITDYDVPHGHVSGQVFYVNGKIASKYNRIDTAAVWIYDGFGTSGNAITGYSDNVGSFSYRLDNSAIDYNTAFDQVGVGDHTYEISCTYTNYYAEGATTLKSNTGTIRLVEEYFVVVSQSVDQTTCSHNFATTDIVKGSCTDPGVAVQSCSKCGLVKEVANGGDGHSYGGWTTVKATCTADGHQKRTCSACGNVEMVTLPATGHKYHAVKTDATCSSYAKYTMTCTGCGDNYIMTADEMASQWLDEIPSGMDASLFDTRTQYRYSDYQTQTSYATSLAGYTLKSSEWVQSGTGSVKYVPSWPAGFDTGSSIYSQYNKSKVTSTETDTTKTVTGPDGHVGYLYYHWCSSSDANGYSYANKSSTHTIFHAYYDTTDPGNYTCDHSDMSYKTSNSACPNHYSNWFFVTEVYQQDYTSYKKLFTYERWTDWSDWSTNVATASGTRKVETRTQYKLKDATMGDHTWTNGTCSSCGTVCSHDFVDGFCTQCGMAEPIKDYYLFGFINGANYACEEDADNMGQYKFVDGKLVATFSQVSYVAVKTGGNYKWYMTEGYQGDATSVTLHETGTIGNADKLRVPRGREITFTLKVNDDGTLTLSYVAAGCEHSWQNGTCSNCDEVCEHVSWAFGTCEDCGLVCAHRWEEGTCAVCGSVCAHKYQNNVCKHCGYHKPLKEYYLFGWINDSDYGCEGDYQNLGQYKFENGVLVATFPSDSYVAVKSHDNMDWYMTNGWLGYDVTAATLYNTNTGITAEKLYVPGGREVTFYLVDNGNDTYTLSYVVKECEHPGHDVDGICTVCGETVGHSYVDGTCACGAKDPDAVADPGLTMRYPTLSFEDEIIYNVYYSVADISDVEEMGLMLLSSRNDAATMDDAVGTVPGYITNGTVYMVKSESVPAAHLGDTVYFKVYAKLTDGTYRYSAAGGYNAKAYANSILSGSNTDEMKSLVVAMLNYGAEAQKFFGHNTDKLVNASLTADQKGLVASYDDAMVDDIVKADSAKIGGFVRDNANFKSLYPSVSFDGAFAINFYCTPAITVDDGMTLYWWDADTYANISRFTLGNATGKMTMTQTGGQYWGEVTGIAAKDMDKTYYVSCVFKHNGSYVTTGIIPYSLGKYCEGKAAASGDAQQVFAQATVVYGYYAKGYFASIA